jgi:spore germination cell wall hydrolase CwlJ-like protein
MRETPIKPITTIEVIKIPQEKPKLVRPKIASAIQYTQDELICLAKNIYHEARGEPIEGQKAVARVTYNRKRVQKFDSMCDVVYFKHKGTCAFSWVCEGKDEPKSMDAWHRAIKVAEDFLRNPNCCAGLEKALYFHADYTTPLWSAERYFIRQIGTHLFYK